MGSRTEHQKKSVLLFLALELVAPACDSPAGSNRLILLSPEPRHVGAKVLVDEVLVGQMSDDWCQCDWRARPPFQGPPVCTFARVALKMPAGARSVTIAPGTAKECTQEVRPSLMTWVGGWRRFVPQCSLRYDENIRRALLCALSLKDRETGPRHFVETVAKRGDQPWGVSALARFILREWGQPIEDFLGGPQPVAGLRTFIGRCGEGAVQERDEVVIVRARISPDGKLEAVERLEPANHWAAPELLWELQNAVFLPAAELARDGKGNRFLRFKTGIYEHRVTAFEGPGRKPAGYR